MNKKIALFLEMSQCIPNLFYHRYRVLHDGFLPDTPTDVPIAVTSECRNVPLSELMEQLFLSCDYLERTRLYAEDHQAPYELGTHMGLIWYSVPEKDSSGKLQYVHVLGPAMQNVAGTDRLEQLLRPYEKRGMTFTAKHILLEAMQKLPVLSHSQFASYALMLHYCITGVHIPFQELNQLPDDARAFDSDAQDPSPAAIYQSIYQSEGLLREQLFLDEPPEKLLQTSMYFLPTEDSHISNPARRLQDQALIITAACARAAVSAGLSVQEAYTLADEYIGRIETPHSPTGLVHLLQEMYLKLWEACKNRRCQKEQCCSPNIRNACEYIRRHICEEIRMEDLARASHLSPYYFSQVFLREIGQSFLSYVREQKIRYAAHLLLTTEDSIESIIHKTGFSSQGHFYTDFRKLMGVTPKQWRLGKTE